MSAEHVRRLRLLVDALRSGRYAQAVGALRKDDAYCCLGVACDVFRVETGRGDWTDERETWEFKIEDGRYGVEREEGELPDTVAAWFMADTYMTDPMVDVPAIGGDFTSRMTPPRTLSTLNDEGVAFAEIADLIEQQLIRYVEPIEDPEEVPTP